MKNLVKASLIISIISLLVISCKNKDQEIVLTDLDISLRANNQRNIAQPGIIPSDAKIMQMAMLGQYKWKDYFDYLNNELYELKDEHYFENLEWFTINRILEDEDFLLNAPNSTKDEIWKRIESRKLVNDPTVTYHFLKSYNPELDKIELSKRFYHIYTNFDKCYKDPEARQKKYDSHKETYEKMIPEMFNRWGQPLFTLQ